MPKFEFMHDFSSKWNVFDCWTFVAQLCPLTGNVVMLVLWLQLSLQTHDHECEKLLPFVTLSDIFQK